MTEEVFELRVAHRREGEAVGYETRWCSAQGNPLPPRYQVQWVPRLGTALSFKRMRRMTTKV